MITIFDCAIQLVYLGVGLAWVLLGWFLLAGSVGAFLGQLFWAVDVVVDSLGGVDWWIGSVLEHNE